MPVKLIHCCAVLLLALCFLARSQGGEKVLTYTPGPADNPLKGFMPYNGVYSTFPHSMEYFYVAWKDIQTDYAVFNWDLLELFLADVSARGHHTIFRVYADYPKRSYGVPAFLDTIPRHAYTDYGNTTSLSPDYDNVNLRRAMLATIAAMGARYDGDPRIAFIEVGFLGFWGEWHTYPHTTWFASTATQNMVLDAFAQAFHKTKLVMREPKAGTNMPARRMGYHDDSFCYSTYGTIAGASWYFWPLLLAAGEGQKWRTESIGGELRPEIQLSVWDDPCVCTGGAGLGTQYFSQCVDSTHASWMLAHNLFTPGNSGAPHDRALTGAKRMGYDLSVATVSLPDTLADDSATVALTMRNTGVAPFAYPWVVQVGLADTTNAVVRSWNTAWDITTVVDSARRPFTVSVPLAGVPPGKYTVLLHIVNPLPKGKPLALANSAWGRNVQGWLSLGTIVRTGPTVIREVAIDDPSGFALAQNYPNPFNPSTTIPYRIPATMHVRLTIHDALGRETAVLVDGLRGPGDHEVSFDATGLAGGVYFCRLDVRPLISASGSDSRDDAGSFVSTRRLVLIR
jgi:hypothetical protein